MFRYTTEYINDTDILVRVYKKGERKIYHKFTVSDYGDWNAVEDEIKRTIETLEEVERNNHSTH